MYSFIMMGDSGRVFPCVSSQQGFWGPHAWPGSRGSPRWPGSEFQAAFETEFVLPPRSPKLNGCVERAQRTHTEEFYEVTEFSLEVAALNRELLTWEHTYSTVRPHQALGYKTHHQFVTQWYHQRKETKCP